MKRIIFTALSLLATASYAHQLVMDMAPRWEGGYGVQTRVTHANDRTETWLEGVYTFKPSLRMTLKVPYAGGEVGDAIFAVPLKRYTNKGAFTSNWGITPSVRMPTSGGDDWDAGLGISYSSETTTVYQLYDLYTLGDVVGLDVNVGRAWKDGDGGAFFALWDVSAQDSDTGSRVLTGPVGVYFQGGVIFRAEFKVASSAPWLVTLSQYKGWMFLVSGALIALAAWAVLRLGRVCPTDPELAAACANADKWNKRFIGISAVMWLLGFATAYLLPLTQT